MTDLACVLILIACLAATSCLVWLCDALRKSDSHERKGNTP